MKIATIIGARPQFVKAATVSRAIAKHQEQQCLAETVQPASINEIIIHTGQHFEDNMSEIFFRELEIPLPHYHLGVGGGTHGQNTGRMLEAIETVLLTERPDWVLVYGDTDSTLAGALAAAKLHIPVAHVEAGLRSFNRLMPEEINRIVTDQLSTLLFCPTQRAVSNLAQEGFPHKLSGSSVQKIVNVGDVMYDAALYFAGLANETSRILSTLNLPAKGYVLATIHRAENTDDPVRLVNIISALNQIATETPVVLPLHPRTANSFNRLGAEAIRENSRLITFIEPVGYLDMVVLEKNASLIVTDSGGVQKEAYFHRVPCVTVRDETEWVELVEAGVNCLAAADRNSIVEAYGRMKNTEVGGGKLYGEGDAAGRIVRTLMGFSLEFHR